MTTKGIIRAKLDKSAYSVASLADESDEKQYWLSKSPYQRLRALELMRQIVYGYDPATERMQRVFEVVQRKPVENPPLADDKNRVS